MEGRAGDSSSWFDQVTHTEAEPGACKRKKTNAKQQAPGHLSPLVSEEARKEVMGAIYEHVAGREPPQKNIASRAISAYYPDFTPATVKAVAGQVLCMIAEYHLACASMGSMTTSPILPEAVEQYLPPLADYTHPGSTGLTDVRVHDHKSCSLHIGVWLHRVDMSLSWEREASESLVQWRHVRGPLQSYLLAPRTGTSALKRLSLESYKRTGRNMRGQRRGSGPCSNTATADGPGSPKSLTSCPRGWRLLWTRGFIKKPRQGWVYSEPPSRRLRPPWLRVKITLRRAG